MSKPLTNHELVIQSARDSFREKLKYCLYDGAALLSVDELEKDINAVCQEMLSFLRSEAKPRSGAPEKAE